MLLTVFDENELNVHFIRDFIQEDTADHFFKELQALPFYTPTLILRGEEIKPKRKVLAFGDSGLSYAFSGTTISALEWTPLMLELRDQVEKQSGCSFNFVLLNYYPNGSSYLLHHKTNVNDLDESSAISELCFGAKRTLEFRKPHCDDVRIAFDHGSMICMFKPTNELFFRQILPEPDIKKPTIILTFLQLVSKSASCKKQRLNFFPASSNEVSSPMIEESNIKEGSSEQTSSEQTVQEKPENNALKQEQSILSIEDQSSLTMYHQDWFDRHFQNLEDCDPLLAEFNLCWGTFLQIRLENHDSLRIHIRNFKEMKNGDKYPTKQGVMMTAATWDNFSRKLPNFSFYSADDSFIANNQLLIMCLDEDYCFLQQLFNLKNAGFYLKNTGIRLSIDQILKLTELVPEITETIIDILLTRVVPNAVFKKLPVCLNHMDFDSAKSHFLYCLEQELGSSACKIFYCIGCKFRSNSQLKHDCMMVETKEKFLLCKDSALLNVNVFELVKNICRNCTCQFTKTFFKCFDSQFFEEYFENLFQ